jgi:hypothetical protein
VTFDWHQTPVRPGGLMRCCLATLNEHMAGRCEAPKEGERLGCRYCKNVGGGMIFRGGAWEWADGT